ncbi:VOC family protein [Aureisphaera galaxeae]|uniref:VOC family protein n=1 Tax=Aureisphaera galaxeae TaxID=1538023 RepID=UPI0023501D3E|nr:VOC family protein [Aureisphaera galaxeae]MDC8005678.1 VOC family protein [Aureisphaera galaxeae]
MMKLNTYLTFNGNCEEAMNFYKEILNGEFTTFMRFGEAPPNAFPVADEHKDLVMHCTLEFGEATLMASDTNQPEHLVTGSNYHLSIGTDVTKGEAAFNALSEGGQILMPYADVFWGGKFGMLVDKYGIQWMVSSDHKPED